MCVSLINLSVMIKTGNCWQSQTEGKLFEGERDLVYIIGLCVGPRSLSVDESMYWFVWAVQSDRQTVRGRGYHILCCYGNCKRHHNSSCEACSVHLRFLH